jgi:glycosyltransferase involved in cell wall biosynthesis
MSKLVPRSATRRVKVTRLIPVLDFGGVETTFALEADRIDRDRFDFQVCTFWKPGAAADRIRAAGIDVTSLEVDPSIRNPAATRALYRYLRRQRPDILHASIGEANFHAALVGRVGGARRVVMEEQGLPSRQLAGRLVHAGLYRMVDAVVGVSKASCDYLVDREWAPPGRVHLIYNAVADRFLHAPPGPRVADERFRFLTVGRLVEVKNQALLVRAFAGIATDLPQAELTIIGDGPLKGELQALVRQLGLEGRVHLPGFDNNVVALLDSADCFALPSISEGFGIAAVEAMARHLPVIVSDAGALPEVAQRVGTQWIVPALDLEGWTAAMRQMATLDPMLRADLRRTARSIAESFSEQRHVQALEGLYDQLMG